MPKYVNNAPNADINFGYILFTPISCEIVFKISNIIVEYLIFNFELSTKFGQFSLESQNENDYNLADCVWMWLKEK